MPTRAMISGAGSGLGRATALALAERGCTLALVDIDTAATNAVAAECGAPTTVIIQDLTAEAAPKQRWSARSRHSAASTLW